MKTIYSPKAAPKYEPETARGVGTPAEVEQYFPEEGDAELFVTVEEREAFEAESGHELENDVLNEGQWTEFMEFLGLNKSDTPTIAPIQAVAEYLLNSKGERIGELFGSMDERVPAACEIVRAVNAHAGLVAALVRAEMEIARYRDHAFATSPVARYAGGLKEIDALLSEMRAALTSAKGGK
jgi:hypothetical protein